MQESIQEAQYQLIIVGGGAAGLTAGLYAGRGGLKVLLVEKAATGGQVLVTAMVDNYPGFVEGISGYELMEKFAAHAERFGLVKKDAAITALELDGSVKTVHLESGEQLTAYTIILCTGARPSKLGVPGEEIYIGRGVSYCSTCDGPFYRNQEIAVVGGGNTAVQESLHLAKFAKKITIIHRRDTLRASQILQDRAFAEPKIEFLWNTQVKEIVGEEPQGVKALLLEHQDGQQSTLQIAGVFPLIGVMPNNEILPLDRLQTDESGFIITDENMATNIPGVYAAGDICSKHFRQIVTAASEGAIAELSVEHYLSVRGL